jgi:hypothetical protein
VTLCLALGSKSFRGLEIGQSHACGNPRSCCW